jgi:hypothetical protein
LKGWLGTDRIFDHDVGLRLQCQGSTRYATFASDYSSDGNSAKAAVHGKRRDSLLLELKLTLKIAQRNVILKDHIHV